MPLDTGFNRLAWVLPYALGAVGAHRDRADRSPLVARPAAAVAGGGETQIDPGLDARLDDELRNLD